MCIFHIHRIVYLRGNGNSKSAIFGITGRLAIGRGQKQVSRERAGTHPLLCGYGFRSFCKAPKDLLDLFKGWVSVGDLGFHLL